MVSWAYWWTCCTHHFTGWNKNWFHHWNKIFNLSRRIIKAAWRENKRTRLEWTFLVNSGVSWGLWGVDAKNELGEHKVYWKVTFVKGKGRKLNWAGRVNRSGNPTGLRRVQMALWRSLSLGRNVKPCTTVLLSHELGLPWKACDLGPKDRVHQRRNG